MSLEIRFNNREGGHFKEKSLLEYMSARLPDIMATNDTGYVGDSVLWESMKAVLWGSIISCVAGRRKQTEKRLGELNEPLSQRSYKASADPDTLNSIVSQRDEYNIILSAQVCKQMQFEMGDKHCPY